MTTSEAEAFIDRVLTDEAMQQKFQAVTSQDDVLALLAGEDVTCPPADIRDAFLERFGSELSEAELEAIAGGFDTTQQALIGVGAGVGALVVGTGVACAAIAAGAF